MTRHAPPPSRVEGPADDPNSPDDPDPSIDPSDAIDPIDPVEPPIETLRVVEDQWLSAFDDERLEALVEEAMQRSPDLARALAIRDQALSALQLARSALLPRVGAGLVVERDEGHTRYEELVTAELFVSWEADLWGRLRTQERASDRDAFAAAADYEYLRQSYAALIAQAWYSAIAARQLMDINMERVASEEATASAASRRAEAGVGRALEDDLTQANVALARSALAASRQALDESIRALELLVGRYPSTELALAPALPELRAMPGVGVPAELLDRRPDLRAAESRVAAAFHREANARIARLPSIRLMASGGFAISPAEAIWTLAADLLAPLFTGGAIEAQIEIASAQQRATIAEYVRIVLRAFGEVENALANADYLDQRARELDTAVTRLASANRTAEARYEAGVLTIFELNQTRQSYYTSRSQQITVHYERLRQRINLHTALGGSFE